MLVVFEQKRIKCGAVWSTPGHALSLAGYNRRRHCLWVLVGAIKKSDVMSCFYGSFFSSNFCI